MLIASLTGGVFHGWRWLPISQRLSSRMPFKVFIASSLVATGKLTRYVGRTPYLSKMDWSLGIRDMFLTVTSSRQDPLILLGIDSDNEVHFRIPLFL